jgi:hypothetical protein
MPKGKNCVRRSLLGHRAKDRLAAQSTYDLNVE